jgi:hypothetical protein
MKKPEAVSGVPDRLLAIRAYLSEESGLNKPMPYKDFAETWCDTNASNLSEWMRFAHLPRVPNMIFLCEKTGLTLDWIYRGELPTDTRKLRRLIEALERRITWQNLPDA